MGNVLFEDSLYDTVERLTAHVNIALSTDSFTAARSFVEQMRGAFLLYRTAGFQVPEGLEAVPDALNQCIGDCEAASRVASFSLEGL